MTSVCRSTAHQLRIIGSVRRYLTTDAVKSLVNGLVTSRLDYCNALLVGLPRCLIDRLQRIQNRAARLITRTQRHQHITPVLKSLHWLPVSVRIEYKVILYAFKVLSGCAPTYLVDLVQQKSLPRSMRSSSYIQLMVPKTRTKTYGERSFRYAAARLWNSLPPSMRTLTTVGAFKRKLKTHLFTVYYE